MKTQQEEMVTDVAGLLEMVQEDLTSASMAAMELVVERSAWNLELSSQASAAISNDKFS